MAPEILQGHFSKAADIFSLGIAMLELACYMDLPSNGPLWHELRHGILPEEFINSELRTSCLLKWQVAKAFLFAQKYHWSCSR